MNKGLMITAGAIALASLFTYSRDLQAETKAQERPIEISGNMLRASAMAYAHYVKPGRSTEHTAVRLSETADNYKIYFRRIDKELIAGGGMEYSITKKGFKLSWKDDK